MEEWKGDRMCVSAYVLHPGDSARRVRRCAAQRMSAHRINDDVTEVRVKNNHTEGQPLGRGVDAMKNIWGWSLLRAIEH
jgi:hypothetical protein